MTDDQKAAAILAESVRGDSALEEAELLLAAGKAAGAVSRAYYAAYHYARALLLLAGEEPRTHSGIVRLLQRTYVQTRRLTPEVAALFSRLMTFRHEADYTAEFVFTNDMAAKDVEEARVFVAAARALLAPTS